MDSNLVRIPGAMRRTSHNHRTQVQTQQQQGLGGGAASAIRMTGDNTTTTRPDDAYDKLVHMVMSPVVSGALAAQTAQVFGTMIKIGVLNEDDKATSVINLTNIDNGRAYDSILRAVPMFSQTMTMQPVAVQIRTTDGTVLDPSEVVRDYSHWYIARWRAAIKMAKRKRASTDLTPRETRLEDEINEAVVQQILIRTEQRNLIPRRTREDDTTLDIDRILRSMHSVIQSPDTNSDVRPLDADVLDFFEKLASGEINYIDWQNMNDGGTDDITGAGAVSYAPPVPENITDEEYALVDPKYLRVTPNNIGISSGYPTPRVEENSLVYDGESRQVFDWVYSSAQPLRSRTYVFTFRGLNAQRLSGLSFPSLMATLLPQYNNMRLAEEARIFAIGQSTRNRMIVSMQSTHVPEKGADQDVYVANDLSAGRGNDGRASKRRRTGGGFPGRAALHVAEKEGEVQAEMQKAFHEIMQNHRDLFRDQDGKSPGPINIRGFVNDDGTVSTVMIPGSGEMPVEELYVGEKLEKFVEPKVPVHEKERDVQWVHAVAEVLRVLPSLIRLEANGADSGGSRVTTGSSLLVRMIMADFQLRIQILRQIAYDFFDELQSLQRRLLSQYKSMILDRVVESSANVGARNIAGLFSKSIVGGRADTTVRVQQQLSQRRTYREIGEVISSNAAFFTNNIDYERGRVLANALVAVSARRQKDVIEKTSGVDMDRMSVVYEETSLVDHGAMMEILKVTGAEWDEGWKIVAANAGVPTAALNSMVQAIKRNQADPGGEILPLASGVAKE